MFRPGFKKNNAGLTIIELLVGVLILLIVLALIYAIYFSGYDFWELERDKLDLQAEARTAVANMERELRMATRTSTLALSPNIVIPASPNNNRITFYLPQDADGNNIPDIANDQIIWDMNNPVEYRYFPAERELRRLDNNGGRVMATDVDAAQFIDASIDGTLFSNEVKIALDLGRTTSQKRAVTFGLSSAIKMRN